MRLADYELNLEVVACEGLIVMKLLSGRVIDRSDAAAVLRANRDSVDEAYLVDWIGRLALGNEFAKIWEEAFPGQSPPDR